MRLRAIDFLYGFMPCEAFIHVMLPSILLLFLGQKDIKAVTDIFQSFLSYFFARPIVILNMLLLGLFVIVRRHSFLFDFTTKACCNTHVMNKTISFFLSFLEYPSKKMEQHSNFVKKDL